MTSTIPTAARSAATQFRWRQLSHSGSVFDHWALDNVVIDAQPATFLTLTIPNSVSEGDAPVGGVVSASPVPTNNLTVTLSSLDTSELTVPGAVTILAGQSNAAFNLTVLDDPDLDGSQTVQVTATATGYTGATRSVTVLDNETAALLLTVPATVTEGGGSYLSRVDASATPAANITVALTSSDTTEILVPATVVIPAGQTSAVFSVTVVDDNQLDGVQTATVTAHVPNWTDGSALITVLDNETTNLTVTLPANVSEAAGVLTGVASVRLSGTLTNSLLVSLTSGVPSRLTVPPIVTIAAGQLSNTFNLTLLDNNLQDGNQIAGVIVSAAGFLNGTNSILVMDDDVPPSILNQPTNQTVYVGQAAVFAVIAGGKTPLSYQWQFNGTNISGATDSTLTLTNVQLSRAGSYAVMVTNVYGALGSSNVMLTVNVPVCAPPASGILAWWRGEGNASDTIGTNAGTLIGGAGFNTGEVGQGFSFDGTSSYVSIPNSELLNAIASRLTVELWFQANTTNANVNWAGIVAKGNTSWRLQATYGAKVLTFSATGTSGGDLQGTRNVNDGQWHHVAGVYDGTNMFLYVDGTLDVSKPATGLIAQNNYPVAIGANANPPSGANYLFDGSVDEVALYTRALSANEIFAIYIAGSLGKCYTPIPPTITTQPASRTNVAETLATFSVVAAGTALLSYQWLFNGANINDATNATLALTNVQLSQAGSYAAMVSNDVGATNSVDAILTVTVPPPPTITSQPASRTNIEGTLATFSVTANGAGLLSYQWQFNGTDINDATNATLMLANVQLNQTGNYAVMVTSPYGSTASSNAVLTVTVPACVPPPSGMMAWWRGEGDASDAVGASGGTLVGAAGFNTGEVGQGFSFDGTSSYVSIPDSPLLDTISNRFTVELWFRVNATSANGDWAGIVAKGNTSWRLQAYGAEALTFSATGTSGGDLQGTRNVNDGQWHHVACVYDGTNMFLYTDGTLDVSKPSTGLIAQNNYPVAIGANANPPGVNYLFDGSVDEVALYNRALSADEIAAIYIVGSFGKCYTPTPPTITSQPASRTNVVGTLTTFSVTANGTGPLSYQWLFNGTNINNATNATLTLTNVQLNQTGNYAVTVTNLYGSTVSSNAVLTVTISDCAPPASGIVAWWRGEGNASDTVGTSVGTLIGAAGFNTGEVGQGFSFNGSGSYVSITNSALLNSLTNRLTVELWFRVNTTNANANWAGIVAKGDATWRLQGTYGAKTVTFSATGTSGGDLQGTRNVNDGQWHHVACVYDGTNMFLYTDGTLDVSKPSTGRIATNTLPLLIGANAIYYFNGLIDEVSLYNRALSANEVAAIYAAGSNGKCVPTPPIITTQPTGQTNVGGTLVTFSVIATGTPPLSYIWQKNTAPIGGLSGTSLILTNVTRINSGTYRIVITNIAGSITSSNAVLLVRVPQHLGTPVQLPDGTLVLVSSDADGGIISAADLPRFAAQASTNLVNWNTLPGALTLTNSSLRFYDATTNGPMRFYRIIEN